ncbi:non-ribosomal peptide synthetase [Roseovarius pelagicus]|uniref:Amino acid adenylation domain-containing protein n=1 Tax=Roseovarius pelagicus TaxID=2980108 RepID=A0ABY6D6D1_9RHOB|nr:non-ribosomal peptide synthetase [Roseovarius pelagicus]UXX81424.1 amino acid adenylation domain-containing protein [Roseovarius pelagicus]
MTATGPSNQCELQLSAMQRVLWASQTRHPDAPVQNMAVLAHLNGAIDSNRFVRAFGTVVQASDALRSRMMSDGRAAAVVLADPPRPAEVMTLARDEVAEWARRRSARPLDMGVCGYDSVLLQHEDETASWYLNIHHTLTDAASSALVFEATAAAYGDGSLLGPNSYYDWAAALPRAPDPMAARALQHWKERIAPPRPGAFYPASDLPTPYASQVAVPLSDGLRNLVETHEQGAYAIPVGNLSHTVLLTTALALLIHRVSGECAFSIGLPVSHRTNATSRRCIGALVEVFPVDIEIAAGDTHAAIHRRVAGAVLDTLKFAIRGTSPAPDYAALVNVLPPETAPNRFGDIPARVQWLHCGAMDAGQALRLHSVRYADAQGRTPERFDLVLDIGHGAAGDDYRGRVVEHLQVILHAMLEDPESPIGAASICSAADDARIAEWESAPDIDGAAVLLPDRLKAALADNPAVVIEQDGIALTGDELWQWARGVAASIGQASGPGTRIGVALGPSVQAVVAIYGILLAGASFVPIDPSQPEARRKTLAKRAGLAQVFTSADQVDDLRGHSTAPLPALKDDNEAYLLFTSGSAGEPKGVPITHLGLARYIRFALASFFDAPEPPIAALFGSLTFDLTLTTVFPPILAGGRLVVCSGSGAEAMARIAATPVITWCKATPSHLKLLTRLMPSGHALQTLVVGGEAFGMRIAEDLRAANPDIEIFNEYGPTEAVVGCMIYRLGMELSGTDVLIGKPAPGTTLRVVDGYDQRVPVGVAGELLISHPGVMAGYLGDTGDDPFVGLDGKRYYRSGDIVRLRNDGELEYLGRFDTQIKVGGIRIDLTEIEHALRCHPSVSSVAAGCWAPSLKPIRVHCARCGLPDDVPGVAFDEGRICQTCREYDRVAPVARSWFRTEDDLAARQPVARAHATGKYDCMHLLSGGKDSTYALYRLIDLGFTPYALTLDNGYISEQAKDNIRRIVDELGIDHEFATTPAMNAIFRDSLATHSNVCNGCFKTIYTLATNRALKLGIPLIVTGLSRGQLFETRLIPQQFALDRFDPDAIDQAVLRARRSYHRIDDVANRLLDTRAFREDAMFEQIEYLDFYRYIDVDLTTMLDYLTKRTPWLRPEDTGRSTNCLINAAGIHTHKIEQGYHNYAVPYAWDVRLGHKTRDEAMAELDDNLDADDVARMLSEIGYDPAPRQTLTAWIKLTEGVTQAPSAAEFRAFLAQTLPAHAMPSAFVAVPEFSLTRNGKLDMAALPGPERVHRHTLEPVAAPSNTTEETIIAAWEKQLRIEPIGVDDSFFALGGDSLAALEMIVRLSAEFGARIREDLAFTHTTPRALAEEIDRLLASGGAVRPTAQLPDITQLPADEAPPLSVGEQTLLFDQRARPEALMYNVARVFHVAGAVDAPRFETALRTVVPQHQPLSWSYGTPRRKLEPNDAIKVVISREPVTPEAVPAAISDFQTAPFDLSQGPLLRCLVQPVRDGSTIITFAIHHVSGDHESFDRLWAQLIDALAGHPLPELKTDYASFCHWQAETEQAAHRAFWLKCGSQEPPSALLCAPAVTHAPDGFLTCRSALSPNEVRAAKETPVSLALAATAAALRLYTTGNDLEIGIVASTRDHPDAQPLFGYLLNPLPLRLDCAQDSKFSELAQQAGNAVGRALPHRSYPITQILQDRRAAGLAAEPLRVLVAYDDAIPTELDGRIVTQRVAFNGFAVTDLSVFVELRRDTVDIGIEYSGKTIGQEVANTILKRAEDALCRAVRSPDDTVSRVGDAAANRSLLVGPDLKDTRLILDRISENVRQYPDATAVTCAGQSINWAQLGQWSEAIATRLRASGIGSGDRVIVCKDRSAHLIAAMLGVLRAGGVYVPVDPTYPPERVRMIVSGAKARLAIVDDPAAAEGTMDIPCLGVTENGLDGGGWNGPTTRFPAPKADDPAYLIFTSGSTGAPRGVSITHRQLSDSTNARDIFYDAPPTRFAMLSSIAFDSSVAGLFWTLATGGTLVFPTEREARDVDALAHLLSGATHTLCVPTLYNAMLDRRDPAEAWPTHIIVAGEACPGSTLTRHFDEVPGSALINEYGPTETTVWATAYQCKPTDNLVSSGQPIAGTWVAVVDADGKILPSGMPGDLIIGGAGVADGYADNPAATAERFGTRADQPAFAELPGPRYFRTGDRAVISGRQLNYLGRADDQINVGGARVEPGDIENTLLRTRMISAAVVTAADVRPLPELLGSLPAETVAAAMREAGASNDPTAALTQFLQREGQPDLRLVAHVEHSGALDTNALCAAAARDLPPHMRPALYVVHDSLPRTPNGKLDRAAAADLPIIEQAPADPPPRPAAAPNDAIVAKLTGLFQHEVRNPSFGPQDSLFDHGGNSLTAIRLLLAIEETFGVRLSTTVLYEAPSPVALAAHLATGDGDTDAAPIFIVPCDVGYSAPPPAFHLALTAHRPAEYLEHPCMRPGTPPIWTLAELAQIYVGQIEKRWPTGPILLGAFCIGAYVATEIARQFAAKGRPIAHLALLDPNIPRLQVMRMHMEAGLPYNGGAKTLAGRAIDLCDRVINARLLLGDGYLQGDRRRSKALRAYGIYVSMRYLRRFNGAPEHLSLDYWARSLMISAGAYDDLTPYTGRVDIIASEEHRATLEGNPEFLQAILPDHTIHYAEDTHWDIGMTAKTAKCVSDCFKSALDGITQESAG